MAVVAPVTNQSSAARADSRPFQVRKTEAGYADEEVSISPLAVEHRTLDVDTVGPLLEGDWD